MLFAILKRANFFRYSIIYLLVGEIVFFGMCSTLYAGAGDEICSEQVRPAYNSQYSQDSGFISSDTDEQDEVRGKFVDSFHPVNVENEKGITFHDVVAREPANKGEPWQMVSQYNIRLSNLPAGQLRVFERVSERGGDTKSVRYGVKLQYSKELDLFVRTVPVPFYYRNKYVSCIFVNLILLLRRLNKDNPVAKYVFVFKEQEGYISNFSLASDNLHKDEVSFFPLRELGDEFDLI